MKDQSERNTKEKLVQVAERLFAEKGFDGASVRDICAGAGANLGAVTYHFGGKEALFAEVLDRRIQPMLQTGMEIVQSAMEPEQKLRALLEAYAMHVLHRDPALRAFFAEVIQGGRRLPQKAMEALHWRNRVFGEIVNEGVVKGAFRECDVENAAWIFFGMIAAFILTEPHLLKGEAAANGYSGDEVRRITGTAADLFFKGLRRGPGGSE